MAKRTSRQERYHNGLEEVGDEGLEPPAFSV